MGRKAASNARFIAGVFFCALLQACAGFAPQTAALLDGLPEGLPERVELAEVPFFAQSEYQCGPAALATLLVNSGVKTTPEALVPQAMADAFRSGNLGIMDYVRMKNVQADTSMRESIAGGDKPRNEGTT